MNFKKIALPLLCTTIIFGSAQLNAMEKKIEEEKEKQEVVQPESSLKKAFANFLETSTTCGKLLLGGGLFYLGLRVCEALPDDHKLSAGAAGVVAIVGGGGLLYWGADDIKNSITINNKIKEQRLRELNKN